MAERSSGIALSVVAIAAMMAMLFFLRNILVPLVLAFVLAVLVNALVRHIADRSPRAPRWAVLSLAALSVLVCAVAATFVITQGAAQIVREAPALIAKMEGIVQESGQALGLREPLHLATLTGDIDIPQIAGSVAGNVGGLLSGFLLTITYFVFILVGRRSMRRKLAGISGVGGRSGEVEATISQISNDIETYIWVQTITGVMLAAAAALVMFAVGLDNVLFWAIVLFLLGYIPMIGVTVGSLLPALFALLQFTSWWQAAVVFGGIQVAAFIVGNFVYPRLQAETQNIDPVSTLLSLAFWGSLWGLAGAFLAVPLTLMVMMICARFPQTRWVAVLLSNDGHPGSPKPGHSSNGEVSTRTAGTEPPACH